MPQLPPIKILIVDDKPGNIEAFKCVLAHPDYEFVACHSGAEALAALLRGDDYAVILMDVRMSEMDGLECVRMLKQRRATREIPIIFVTAEPEALKLEGEGYAIGAVDYLMWPPDGYVLRSKVAVFVEIFRHQRALLEHKLRESEAKFRDLWESSRDAQVLCFTPEWKLTGGNAAAVALFGARDADHLATMTPGDLSPEYQPDGELSATKAPRLIGQAVSQGSAFFEWTHRRPDDTRFVAEVQLTRLTLEGVTGVQATVRDITERKLAEAELKRALDERTTLLHEVHHRVKNNLTVVASLLSLQQRQSQNAEVAEQLQVSRDRVAAIALVHDQLFGGERFDRIDFKAYLGQLCLGIMKSSGARDRNIHLDLTGEGFLLSVDEAVPCAMLVNELVGNALKHAFPAGRTGRVWVDLSVDSDGVRRIQVGDDGVGKAQGPTRDGSMGLKLVERLTGQLGASREREAPARGMLCCLRLPKGQSEEGHDA